MNTSVSLAMPLGRLSPWFPDAFRSILNQEVQVPIHFIANGLNATELDLLQRMSQTRDQIYLHKFNERLPMVSNWNRIYSVLDSKYVAILHDDDLLEPEVLNKLANAATALPGCGIYFTRERFIDEHGTFINEFECQTSGTAKLLTKEDLESWAISNRICATGFILDLEKVKLLGGFDESLTYTPDWNLYFSLAAKYGACFLDLHGARYRIGSATGQLSSNFARRGEAISAYHEQQLRNLMLLGLNKDDYSRELNIGLARQARFIKNHFGEILDETGIRSVRCAIRDGLLSKYLGRFGTTVDIWPITLLIDYLLDLRHPDLRLERR